MATETAVLAGGCFWCVEAVFDQLKGIESVRSGYAGGGKKKPRYWQLGMGLAGHAEAVEIVFDPEKISFRDLLTVFFATHDPTTVDRQGADVGPQYRSAIFYTSEEQKTIAFEVIDEINTSDNEGEEIVTEVEPLDEFFEAEEEHQNYYAKNKEQGYCQLVINPKLQKVQAKFAQLLKDSEERSIK